MGPKAKTARQLRGQLMLQISAGRFFRPLVDLHHSAHRRTIYTNVSMLHTASVQFPVGTLTGSTGVEPVSTAMLEAVDRLEKTRWDGTDDFVVATGGDELIDDIAYVASFALNRTFSRSRDLVHKLVPGEETPSRRRGARSLFPHLFAPRQVLTPEELDDLAQFMDELLALDRDSFARVMRVIRRAVDATRRAVDDPTGAYTDLIAALESLGDKGLARPTSWENYDGTKRRIFDRALKGESADLVHKVRAAILEADHAGLTRRFVSSTLARITPDFYRSEAVGSICPPQSADMERMLEAAYRVRSRRSHVLEDLGEEAWVFTDGAEVVFEPTFDRILTLAGVWRVTRHVVRTYIATTPKVAPEPWDYREALPGQITVRLAPQLWIGQAGLDAATAEHRFNGVVESIIGWRSGETDEASNFGTVVEAVEKLVPAMPDGNAKAALVGMYVLWHDYTEPEYHRPDAQVFIEAHIVSLTRPTPSAFATGVLGNRGLPPWTVDEWTLLAKDRHAARRAGKEAALPAKLDALLQLEAADQLEVAGYHDDGLLLAANAVEESPGNEDLIAWESRLRAGNHDSGFDRISFLFGPTSGSGEA